MEVKATNSFFESLKEIGSLKSKWHLFLGWFKYHFNKWNWRLMKTAFKGRPWDSGYLYELEKAKLEEMIAYHEKHKMYVGVEKDIRDMKICVSLIDIFTEKKELYHYTGNVNFVPIEGSEDFKLLDGDDLQYHCDVKVNTKNIMRFVEDDCPYVEYWKEHPHDFYIKKAKYLYHKIRYERDGAWWD